MNLEELSNRIAENADGARANSKLGKAVKLGGVPRSTEFLRIESLPRRVWTDEVAEDLADKLTAALKTPGGQQRLRPVQAIALLEAYNEQGLFGVIRVGGGKTLITLLVALVMGAKRPLLLLPAKLIAKTEREMQQLAKHWKIPTTIRLVSYEKLGRANHALLLEQYKPDLIIGDEIHKIKNPQAAVTRRVRRYQAATPTRMVGLSGTITKRSLRDYAHIASWCLPKGCPLPQKYSELEQWANALDEKCNPVNRSAPGSLLELATEEERKTLDPIVAARRGFARRLMETPGVVKTKDGPADIGCSLQINSLVLNNNNLEAEAHFEQLRRAWEVPDGHPLADAVAVWRHAREMALGFFYRWNPRPPQVWLEARRSWASVCREIITNNRQGLDSELQVARMVADGYGKHLHAPELYRAWKLIEPAFKPNTEAVWFDDTAINAAADWGHKHKGLIWIEQTEFGKKLAEVSGLPFYHRKGLNAEGQPVEAEEGKRSVIVSLGSNSEGRNLQQFHENLITSPMPNGSQWEQTLGRSHRDGQKEDEVTCQVLVNCLEHGTAFHQAVRDAHFMQDTTQQEYKLCFADKDFVSPDELATLRGWRWVK